MYKSNARDVLDEVGPILMTALWAIKVVSSIEKKVRRTLEVPIDIAHNCDGRKL